MSEAALETSSQSGPASLREALEESFKELSADSPAEPESTDLAPTDDDVRPEDDVEVEAAGDEPSEGGEPQGATTVIHAPEHWSAEDREVFESLPSAAQQSWLRREKEYEQGIQKKAEESKPLLEAFGPYRDFLKMRGVDEPTAIRTWVAAQQMLDSDPVNGLKLLIQQFSPDVQTKLLADFGLDPKSDDGEGYQDPETRKLQDELRQLRNQNQQIETQYRTERQQEAYARVQAFRDEKDANGNPAHPYFDEVQDKMRGLLLSGAAQDLNDAYEQAVWTTPQYRESFTEQQRKAVQEEEAKRRAEAAKKAKKTATGVTGKKSVPPPPQKGKSMRDDLLEAWNQSVRGEL